MVPAALVVAQAAAVPATRAQARLHPSRPCQRKKQCSGVAAGDAPKTENKGPAPERAHPLAILKSPHTYSEARQEPTAPRTDFTPVPGDAADTRVFWYTQPRAKSIFTDGLRVPVPCTRYLLCTVKRTTRVYCKYHNIVVGKRFC